ncbi:hypothetical protein M0R45_024604 [Rubus argutus]|uniref:Clp R domain-containing protein n=1 Tax=Rubus argutus TaxID=59490 RepID=A0AAW1WVV9_RUBAR
MAAHSLSKLPTFNPWLGLSLQSSSLTVPKLRSSASTIHLSLPTANRERVSSNEKEPKWSSRAIKSFAMGELEARKLKYPTTGTEAILMGTTLASKFLRANGVTLFKVREETIKLLGKADMYFFSPEHPPLTEEAQRVLDWAVDKKLNLNLMSTVVLDCKTTKPFETEDHVAIVQCDSEEITTSHLLLGIWYEVDSPGHKILAALGFNEGKVKELESLISEPGFIDG